MSQRSISRWAALAAAVAWLLGGVGAARAQPHFRADMGRHPGSSIRFGSVPPPRPFMVAPPTTVRYEHHYPRPPFVVAPPPRAFYRNPYEEPYFRRFRPGYLPVVIGTTQYNFYPALPPVYQTVAVNGVIYYLADGVYYQPYLYQGQTMYMVVPPPIP